MGFFDKLTEIGGALLQKAQKQQASRMKDAAARVKSEGKGEAKLGGKTLREWEGSWQPLGSLATAGLSHLSAYVGLYRARLGGKIVYVGRAVEYDNGGLRKRLSDYTRDSDSARKHASGRLMHQHAGELQMEVLITGGDTGAVEVAKKLEVYFVGLHQPEWNRQLKC